MQEQYDVQVSLQKVEFKSKVNYRKVNLTIYAPDCQPMTYSHIVRHNTVSFYEQTIKFPYCHEASIKITLIPLNKLENEKSRFFNIDIRSVTKMIKNRVQLSEDIQEFNCTVYYEVALFEANMLESSASRDMTEMQTNKDLTCYRASNDSSQKKKKISNPLKALKEEDDSEGDDENDDLMNPLPDKLLGFGPKLKRSVTSPLEEKEQKDQLNRINKQYIRRPTGRKLKSIEEIQNQLQIALTTRFNCDNYKMVERKIASRCDDLKKQLQDLKEERERKEKLKADWMNEPGMLGSRVAMATAFILGLGISMIFRI